MRIFSSCPVRRFAGDGLRAWVFFAFLLGGSPGFASAQFPGELRGKIVDRESGAGVARARVEIVGLGTVAVTDADGGIRLRGLEPGPIEVRVQALGYQGVDLPVRILNGTVTPFLVTLAPQALTLRGLEVRAGGNGSLVISAQAIRTSGAGTLGELLASLPGVVVRRRGPGGPEEISLRGGGTDQLLLLVDGIPLADPLTGGVDLSSIPIESIQRVEVLHGARTARFGSGALTGVVLVSTGGGEAPSSGSTLLAGSLGERGARVRGGTSVRPGAGPPIHLSAGVGIRTMEGRFQFNRGSFLGGGESVRSNADLMAHNGYVDLRADERERGTWRGRFTWDATERGIPGRSFAPSDSARERRGRVSATAGWERTGDAGREAAALHLFRQTMRFQDPAPPLGPPLDTSTSLISSGVETEVERRIPRFEGGRWALGTTVRAWTIDSDQLDGPQPGRAGRVERVDASAHFRFDGEGLELPAGARPAIALRTHRDGATGNWLGAHEVSLGFRFGSLALHSAHRSGFSPPSPGDLFFREGVGIAPNPELRAERVPSEFEFGFSLLRHGTLPSWRGGPSARGETPFHLSLSGELFLGDVRDMIVWAPDFRFIWSPRNVDVNRRGAALRGEVSLPAASLRLGAHWTHSRVTYVRAEAPGSQVAYRPRNSGDVWLERVGTRFRTELRARYTGLRYPVPAPVNELKPFWTIDATVGWEFPLRGWEVTPLMRVDRLLNERSAFIYGFPEPGRTLRIEIRFRRPRTGLRSLSPEPS